MFFQFNEQALAKESQLIRRLCRRVPEVLSHPTFPAIGRLTVAHSECSACSKSLIGHAWLDAGSCKAQPPSAMTG